MFIHTRGSAIRGLPSLDGINKLFVGKKGNKLLAKPSQTDYSIQGWRKAARLLTLQKLRLLSHKTQECKKN